jgi:gliding motility-associated-like protein
MFITDYNGMRYLLFLVIVCTCFILPAQKETNNWYFGDRAGVTFNSGTPAALTNGVINTLEGSAVMSDAEGTLLFYTDGVKVWNRNHVVMPNGAGLTGDSSSTQSALIVPRPGSSTRYYIFTVDMQAGLNLVSDGDGIYSGVRYSEIDMTANGGLGDVLVANKNTPLLTPSTEGLTGIKHANGTDYWVVAHGWENSNYSAFRVTAAGVNATPVQSNAGPLVNDIGSTQFNGFGSIGYMKISPDGRKIAACHSYALKSVVISDFNTATGIVSNPVTVLLQGSPTSDGPYGLEFSNCSEYLYVTELFVTIGTFYASPEKTEIHRFDLNAPDIAASRTLFRTVDFQYVGALQLATDGNIYGASMRRSFDSSTGEYFTVPNNVIHRINNPRLPGATFTLSALNINPLNQPGRRSNLGLPNFVASYFNATNFTIRSSNAIDSIFCLGDTAYFRISTTAYDSIRWNFGDPASGVNNTSTIPYPSHYYATPGTYTVKLYKYLCNQVDSVIKSVIVRPSPVFNIPDTSGCAGTAIVLDPGISGATYNWSTGPTTQTASFSSGGNFSLTVTQNQCSYTDNFTVTFVPAPTATIAPSGPTNFCTPGSVTLSAPDGMDSYQWFNNGVLMPAETGQSITVSSSGSYTVRVELATCFNTSSPTTVTAGASLTMNVTPVGPINLCSGDATTLTITPGGLTNIKWFRNSVEIPGQVTTTLSVNTAGTYFATGESGGCTGTSNTVTVNVNANPVSVSISPSANNICSGTSVTFTANTTNGGSAPAYQWFLNGNPVGTNSTTYTNASFSNNDQVRAVLTSNISCPTGNPASSNTVTMTVNASLPVSVSVAPSSNPICTGSSVTFTATPTNGGSAPAYQWFLNGNPVGTNSPTYTNASLSNGTQVYVVLTSNAPCATGNPATSNTVTMTVNPAVPASVTITPSANPVCSGTSVTYTATPTNGGSSPTYQWFLNGNPVGTNSPTYTNVSPANGAQVYVVMTSNAPCATGSPATSNTVNMTVSTSLPVSVSIAASSNPFCAGQSITFTATPTNGGSSPTYQWFLNGNPVGSNSPTYTHASLSNGDQVYALLTSNSSCASGNPATSNTITMSVSSGLPVGVSISPSANPFCAGTSVTFTATPTNGGSSPTYQWFLNGNPVGSNSPIYTNSSLSNGNQVYVVLTSELSCATGNPATSNTVTMSASYALPVSVSISPSENPLCSGTPVTISATPVNGGASPSYHWFLNGNPVGSNNPEYTYEYFSNGDQVWVQLTSNDPCATGNPATSPVLTLTVNPLPVFDLGQNQQLCPGSQVLLDPGVTNAAYNWSTGETTPTITVTTADTYVVAITQNGCTSFDQVYISFDLPSPSTIFLGNDTTICEGDILVLIAGNQQGVNYAWQDGASGSTYPVTTSGVYQVTASNACGTVSASRVINTDPCASCGVYVPSGFSPNGDGVNDIFAPITTCEITQYRFSVFNRWNEQVFDTDQPGIGWDGIYKGVAQPLDAYVYSVSYFDTTLQRTISYHGVVTLLR